MQIATPSASPVAAALRANWRDSMAHGWTLLPLRLVTAAAFLYAGYNKIKDPQFLNPHARGYFGHFVPFLAKGSPISGFLTHVVAPHAQTFGFLVAYGEFAIGLGTLVGVLVRPAAFFGFICNLMYALSASWHTPLWYHNADLLFCAMWLTLIMAGGSGMALTWDPWLARWAVAHTAAPRRAGLARTLAVLLGVPSGVSLPRRNVAPVAPSQSAGASAKNTLTGGAKSPNAAKESAKPNPAAKTGTAPSGIAPTKKSVPTNTRPIRQAGTRAGTPAGRRG
jgi:uncharacterized membrane protein YphA (DoxX/SURF4 family)